MNRILVVENDEIFGSKITKKLKQNGFDANWSRSGSDALKFIKSKKIDGILLDLNLGEKSELHGEGILNHLKDESYPIIVMTAYDNRISQLFDYDIYTVFRKPVDSSLLIYSLNKGIEFYTLKNRLAKLDAKKKSKKRGINLNSIITILLLISTVLILLFKEDTNNTMYFLLTVVIIIQLIGGQNISKLVLRIKDSVFKIKTKK